MPLEATARAHAARLAEGRRGPALCARDLAAGRGTGPRRPRRGRGLRRLGRSPLARRTAARAGDPRRGLDPGAAGPWKARPRARPRWTPTSRLVASVSPWLRPWMPTCARPTPWPTGFTWARTGLPGACRQTRPPHATPREPRPRAGAWRTARHGAPKFWMIGKPCGGPWALPRCPRLRWRPGSRAGRPCAAGSRPWPPRAPRRDGFRPRPEPCAGPLSRPLAAWASPPRPRTRRWTPCLPWPAPRASATTPCAAPPRTTPAARRRSTSGSNRPAPDLARAREDMAQWAERWAEAVRTLGLAPTAPPPEAQEVLDTLAQLAAAVDKAEEKAGRIRDIEADFAAYKAAVAEAVGRFAPELADENPMEAVKKLSHSARGHTRRSQGARQAGARTRAPGAHGARRPQRRGAPRPDPAPALRQGPMRGPRRAARGANAAAASGFAWRRSWPPCASAWPSLRRARTPRRWQPRPWSWTRTRRRRTWLALLPSWRSSPPSATN